MEENAANNNKKKRKRPDIPTFVEQWLLEEFITDARSNIRTTAVYDAYEEVCKSRRVKPVAPPVFGQYVFQIFPGISRRRLLIQKKQEAHYGGLRRRDPSERAATVVVPARPRLGGTIQFQERNAENVEERNAEQERNAENVEKLHAEHERNMESLIEAMQVMEDTSYPDQENNAMNVPECLVQLVQVLEIPSWRGQEEEGLRGQRGSMGYESEVWGSGGATIGRAGEESRGVSEISLPPPLVNFFPRVSISRVQAFDEEYDALAKRPRISTRPSDISVIPSEEDLIYHAQYKRFIRVFAEPLWPMRPIHWSIVNDNALQEFLTLRESNLLNLNMLCALASGAAMVGEFTIAKDLFMRCIPMIGAIHENLDYNIGIPLILIAAWARFFMERGKAKALAINLINITLSTCIAANATGTEIYHRAINVKNYLTNGESEEDVIEKQRGNNIETPIDVINKVLRSDVNTVTLIRSVVMNALSHRSRLEREVYHLRTGRLKCQQVGCFYDRTAAISTLKREMLENHMRDSALANEMVLNAVDPMCAGLLATQHHGICAEVCFELGDISRTMQHAVIALDRVQRAGHYNSFLHLMEFPTLLAACGAWEHLTWFTNLTARYSALDLIRELHDKATRLLQDHYREEGEVVEDVHTY